MPLEDFLDSSWTFMVKHLDLGTALCSGLIDPSDPDTAIRSRIVNAHPSHLIDRLLVDFQLYLPRITSLVV